MSDALFQPVPAGSGIRLLLALPIELRRDDYALVERTTLGSIKQAVARLPSGEYVLSMTLPAGVRVSSPFTMRVDGVLDVASLLSRLVANPKVASFLQSRIADEDVSGVLRWAGGVADAVEALAPGLAGLVDGAAAWVAGALHVPGTLERRASRVRFGSREDGSWRWLVDDRLVIDRVPRSELARVTARGGGAGLLQILAPGRVAMNVAMPEGATLVVGSSDRRGDPTSFVARLGDDIADAILDMRTAGRLSDIETLLEHLRDEDLQRILRNPAAAAYVLYTMLRNTSGDERRVHAVVADHLGRHPDDPDAIVLAAEVAAAQGRHQDALRGFLRVRGAGLPLFSFGIGFLGDRLRFYVQSARTPNVGEGSLRMDETTSAEAREALSWVQRYGSYADFRRALLVFPGLDPDDPDDDVQSAQAVERVTARDLASEGRATVAARQVAGVATGGG